MLFSPLTFVAYIFRFSCSLSLHLHLHDLVVFLKYFDTISTFHEASSVCILKVSCRLKPANSRKSRRLGSVQPFFVNSPPWLQAQAQLNSTQLNSTQPTHLPQSATTVISTEVTPPPLLSRLFLPYASLRLHLLR
ncbi:hypothetical protein B0T09DRAFT_40269 [Sordaria sp. MPI-SDFR-AT-0083]|nr:hypothetical protein B0T09DRAFT_40269 [Sordaria sp. MPI-SDFR-AT-0083]